MDELISKHRQEFGIEPEVIVSAPGTINIMGEHTDQYDGLVLEAALSRTLTVALSRRKDNGLRFYAADFNERKRTTIPNLKYRREDRWANYPKGVLNELIQLGYSVEGFDLTVTSEIPLEIGLGSSAAFGVATAVGLSVLYSIDLTPFQIAQSANMAESSFMGIDTPITDHLVATVAQKNSAVLLDLRDLTYEYVPLDFGDLKILITNSNVPQIPVGAALEDHRSHCGECISFLKEHAPGSSLRDYTSRDLKEGMGIIPEHVRRLCTHIMDENERVTESRALLGRGDLAGFGKLMTKSHDSLRDNFEMSCPEIDWLVKRAAEIDGMLGSRMSGPGFGGCTLSLMRTDAIEDYRKRLDEYERIFGFKPEVFVFEAAQGAHLAMPVAGSLS